MRKLTKKAFREWLEVFRPRQIVGLADRCQECPLARFSGMEVAYGFLVNAKKKHIEMPEWAGKFIKRIDNCGAFKITAARALKILEEC